MSNTNTAPAPAKRLRTGELLPDAVEGRAEWRLAAADSMRAFFCRPGQSRGRCEYQQFTLPGFHGVEFSFMLYPAGMGDGPADASSPVVLALLVLGTGCEGVAFEVDLSLELQGPEGGSAGGLSQPVRAEVVSHQLAGSGRVLCEQLWPDGAAVALASCRILASPPPSADGILRQQRDWQKPHGNEEGRGGYKEENGAARRREPDVCPNCEAVHFELQNHLCQSLSEVELKKRLAYGNNRYIQGQLQPKPDGHDKNYRGKISSGQQPAVAVIGCADSRCAPNMFMDAVEGEMFVCRVAGNYVDTSVAGSVQYACQHLGTKMVLICGHTKCGAIAAASSFQDPGIKQDEAPLVTLVRNVKSALDDGNSFGPYPCKDSCDEKLGQIQDLCGQDLVSANVVEQMGIMKNVVSEIAGVSIVGAVYCLESGRVEFFDQYIKDNKIMSFRAGKPLM
eukprot:TRINITY_DN76168_c0_g1_i1.p1 TRINITY_DN76168_c0_g1~~TRINITY_DN76168_c0_g1_i1.p1  ORF type:complete len:450 (+),score=82.09 TRINITY_DN76168_c0_g1_i1:120-1469(+)